MDLSIFFHTLSDKLLEGEYKSGQLGQVIEKSKTEFPDWENADVILLGVNEDRCGQNNLGSAKGPNAIREHFFKLYYNGSLKICDLGNIKEGATREDTSFAIVQVLEQIIKKNKVILFLGGSQALTYDIYKSFERLEQTVNMTGVDPLIEIDSEVEELTNASYLGKIILHQPNYLFNYTNIGYQTYYNHPDIIQLMDELYFERCRLGEARSNLRMTEPLIRNADIFSFDMSAIRHSDAPGNRLNGPHGFYGEEACQLCKYAGMSDKMTVAGIFEYVPEQDHNNQTGRLAAEMLWHILEGVNNRKKDYPLTRKDDYTKYRVSIKDHQYELIFYKSTKTERWWIEVPYPSEKKSKYERHHMVPCNYEDFKLAGRDEMPDVWWKTFQKLGHQ